MQTHLPVNNKQAKLIVVFLQCTESVLRLNLHDNMLQRPQGRCTGKHQVKHHAMQPVQLCYMSPAHLACRQAPGSGLNPKP